MQNITLNFYSWLMVVFFGSMLSETIILYPNIFHNVPDSLSTAMSFLTVIGPRQFFTTLGGILIVAGIAANIANRKNQETRLYLISSFVLLFLFEFLFSVFYFWPRNTIMFVEGSSLHSTEKLRRVAIEFQNGHWIRLAVACTASILAFIAKSRSYRVPSSTRADS